MILVFFSADRLQVDRLAQDFTGAGIPCKVRSGVTFKGAWPTVPETELWIRNKKDLSRAFLLCVYSQTGFAQPPDKRAGLDWWSEILAA
jgi:hypothetical protein